MRKWIAVALLASAPVMAQDLTAFSHDELCIWRAASLIDPAAVPQIDAITAEIARRGDDCSDPGYIQIAEARLRRVDAVVAAQAQAESDRHKERAARIRAAGRAYLELQDQQRQRVVQPAHPVTTTCKDTYAGVRCTSF